MTAIYLRNMTETYYYTRKRERSPMALIDREAAVEAVKNYHHFTEITINGKVSVNRDCFVSHVVAAINALPVKYPFNPDWSPIEPIRETIKERDDALKEVERLKAWLTTAENVIYNMASFITEYSCENCSHVVPCSDCLVDPSDSEKTATNFGWTKEDADE